MVREQERRRPRGYPTPLSESGWLAPTKLAPSTEERIADALERIADALEGGGPPVVAASGL
jgi:hypothetical protein